MTVYINGTTGISGVDGSAGTPAVQGTDTNTGVFYPAADTVGVSTGGSERMRVDSSGNVGIGTSSPAGGYYKLHINSPASLLANGITGAGYWQYGNNATASNNWHCGSEGDGTFRWYNGIYGSGTERMRIDSSGNLLVGATSQIGSEKLGVTSGTTNATQYTTIATKGGSGLYVNQQQTTSVSTSATVILASPNYCTFCLVHGSDGTNRFSDVVLMSVGTGTINVISSLTASGTPAARTYSQSSSTFRLAMASGTYTVQVSALTMNS